MKSSNLFKPTISEEIIAFLFSARSTRIRKKFLWEQVRKRRELSYQNFYQNTHRLKRRGIIDINDGSIELLDKGRMFFVNPTRFIKTKPSKDKKIVVLFDIPETKKKIREWLRSQLKLWEFTMIQKSVWIGDGPLPKEFSERLKLLGVNKGVKIFTIHKKGVS